MGRLVLAPPGAGPGEPDHADLDEMALQLASQLLLLGARRREALAGMTGDFDAHDRALVNHLAGLGAELGYLAAVSTDLRTLEELVSFVTLRRSLGALDGDQAVADPTLEEPAMSPCPLDAARDEIARQEHFLATWEAEAAAKQAEIDDLEDRIGDELLASEDDSPEVLGDAVAAVLELRTGIDLAQRAAATAQARLTAARRDALRAAASLIRDRAAQAQADAEAHQARTDELLDLLEAHEGVRYVLPRPTPGVATSTPVGVPRTALLVDDAARLAQEAARVEAMVAAEDVPEGAWRRAMASADPGGPEAAVLDELADAKRQADEEAVALARRTDEARDRWIKARTAELVAAGTTVPHDPTVLERNMHEQALNEFRQALEAVPYTIEDPFERKRVALASLGAALAAVSAGA